MIDKRYTLTTDATNEIEELLARFERDRGSGPVELRDYLPPHNDPAYAAMVTELARIDLEHDFETGNHPSASIHIASFPDVFQDQSRRAQLAFEEYRLRRCSGENVDAVHVAHRYGVDGSHWPKLKLGTGEAPKTHSTSRRCSKVELATVTVQYPHAGETFAGYPLIERVGEGVFSRVFLARQPDLASRHVVLKVTPLSTDESDRLARLQHSNIIPIYSVHRDGELSCICMPFLGSTTLADLSPSSERWASLSGPAQELASTILQRRDSTLRFTAENPRDTSHEQSLQAEASKPDLARPPNSVDNDSVGLAAYTRIGYVDAFVKLVTGSVEGLAHAH